MLIYFFIIIFTIIIFWIGIDFIRPIFSIAPFHPIKKSDLERVNKLASLKRGQKFYDLGCGDGRVCFYIAKNNPSSEVFGVEISLPFYLFCQIKKIILKRRNLKFIYGNAFNENLSRADVVYTYALNFTVTRIQKKLEKEMKFGAKFISYVFSLKDPKRKVTVDQAYQSQKRIYLAQY
jgi:tRNA G46 methylase TrmB